MSELLQWHFYEKVYRRWVVLFIGPVEKFSEEIKSNGYKDDVEWFKGAKGAAVELGPHNNDKGQNATIIWLSEYETATLVHEIAHLVMMLFDQVGVPISRDNTESFSFYSEYWFTHIQRARKKYPKGNTPKDANEKLVKEMKDAKY